MALIATSNFNGKNGTKFELNLYYDVISQNIAENKSTIRYSLYWKSLGYSGSGSTVTGKINGTPVGTASSIAVNENKLLGTLDQTITHKDDGSFPNTGYSALIDTSWSLGDAEVSGTLTSSNVATIPRASSVTCTDGNIGSSISINVNRASESFSHKLMYAFGNLSGTIAENVGSSYGWTLPIEFYSQIPDAKVGQGGIFCETYQNGIKIGDTQICFFRAYAVENDCKPEPDATIKDTGKKLETGFTTIDLTGSNDILIKGISDVLIKATALAKVYSSIKVIKTYCADGKSGEGTEFVLENVDSGNFTIEATDSRDYKGTKNIVKNMINYIPLTLNIELYRPQPTTGEVCLKVNGNYFNGTFGIANNTLNLKYRYKETNGEYGEYIELVPTIDTKNNRYSLELSLGTNFDYQKSYDFEIMINDKVKILSKTYHVSEGIPMLGLFKTCIEMFGVQTFINTNNFVHVGENVGTDIYATNEKKIGVWVDGKPIYRKMITGTLPIGVGENSFYIPNAIIRNSNGFIKSKYNTWFPLNGEYNGETGYEIDAYLNNERDHLLVKCGSFYTKSSQYEIVVEYTKTTD